MPILSEEIGKRIKGTLQQTEDWWDLCYDTIEKKFYVLHRWDHVALNNLAQDTGSEEHHADTWKGEGADKIAEAKIRLLAEAERL